MNRHFRTLSALLRHAWAVDETWAEGQLPLINAYLSGNYASVASQNDDEQRPIGFSINAQGQRHALAAADTYGSMFSDTGIPEGSVGIIDVRGPIMKEGFCGYYGTEDYTRELNAIYANDKLIGGVILVDSGGGQLCGTPTFYDAIRNPAKPTVVLVNDGMMASAAYWLACGADWIMASQATDQIGSIGVFCRLRDNAKMLDQMGVKEIAVYSKRSKDKNKSYRDALAGDTTLLEAELDESVDFFEQAVRQGRGDKLVVDKNDEPFTGKLYYAQQAIAIGLIDGMGDLSAAIAKVQELAVSSPTGSAQAASTGAASTEFSSPVTATTAAPEMGDTLPTPMSAEAPDQPQSETLTDMFGDKHKNLTALAGVDASAITDEQLNEINANLDRQNIAGVRVISADYLKEAQEAIAAHQADQTTIQTLTKERDDARKQAEEFGAQPGHIGSKAEKGDETTAPTAGRNDRYYSEADQQLDNMAKRRNN